MFAFLLIVQSLIAITLIGVILMQRSEGGGLGVGGSSSGFMTARGAADFLTRSTAVLGGPSSSCRSSWPRSPAHAPTDQDRYVAGGQGWPGPAAVQPAARPAAAPATSAGSQNQSAPAVPLAQ